MRFEKQAKGFTLIEMAIVLVIIGIILAGVMKGRDIVRGAQVKQFSQQFAQKWGTVAQTYYDKTGQQLNDGAANGGVTTASPDGWMDGGLDGRTEAIKDAVEAVGVDLCSIVKSKLIDRTAGAGTVTQYNIPNNNAMCKGDATGGTNVMNPWQAQVDGEYAGPTVVSVDLVALNLTIGGRVLQRNVIVFYNVPTDVAQGIDTAIDARNDGLAGSCVGLGAGYLRNNGSQLTAGAAIEATAWREAVSQTSNQALCQTVGIILDY